MAIKKAAIYDPYLDTLGGGERYCLTVAEILLKNGYKVDIFWSGDKTLIEKAEKRFSLDLKDLNIVPDIFGIKPQNLNLLEAHDDLSKFTNRVADPLRFKVKLSSISKKIKNNRQYDVIFYLSDGSIPLLFGKKNYLHVQVPFVSHYNLPSQISRRLKSKLFTNIICNSQFTAKYQDQAVKNKVLVDYPPVDVDKFYASKS